MRITNEKLGITNEKPEVKEKFDIRKRSKIILQKMKNSTIPNRWKIPSTKAYPKSLDIISNRWEI